jgi:hypothetical protein
MSSLAPNKLRGKPAIDAALKRIRYKDWVLTYERHHGYYLLFWQFTTPDYSEEGYQYPATFDTANLWSTRKHYVSANASVEDIIRTAFLAVKIAEEHETLEAFHVDGVAPFDPHRSIDLGTNL